MLLKINKQDLVKHISIVQKAISSRTTIPILEGILLQTKDNRLKLTGSDGEISIETSVDAFVEEEGELVISSRLFGDIIRKLPNAMIKISVTGTNMNITCEQSEFNIIGQSGKEYPNLPRIDELKTLTLPTELLKDDI